MTLDIRTLSFLAFLMPLFYALWLYMISRSWIRLNGLNIIALSLLVEGSGFFLISLRDLIFPFLSIVVANAFLLAGLVIAHEGIVKLTKIKTRTRLIGPLFVLILIFTFSYNIYFSPDINTRIIIISLFLAIEAGLCAYILSKNVSSDLKIPAYSTAFFFFIAAIILLFRVIWTLFEPPIFHYMLAGRTQGFSILTFILFATGKTFGIIWMTTRMIAIEQDLQAKKEIQQKNDMILYQHKLASMGEMMATIAHQWKQPLATINGILANLGDDYENKRLSSQRLNDYIDRAEKLSLYMSHTIEDFSGYVTPGSQREEFSVIDNIQKAVYLLNSSLKQENIKVTIEGKEGQSIKLYSSKLTQVLITLIHNAEDALIVNQAKNKIINISYYAKNKQQYIVIKDNAGGINNEKMDKIFLPYFTTKSQSKGNGLGLYIAKLITEESLEGKLTANNDQFGAVFTIILPTKD
ncbi:MAG: HAMP domain-containing sensor histidine kinase [Pseudomonadota bacterium]